MQSNYPAGASCDPSAPFNQPMRDESMRCEFEHPEWEECDGCAPHDCECGTPCCDAAMVQVHYEWRGKRYDDLVCCDCAELNYMVPVNSALAIRYLRDALGHEAKHLTPGTVEYVALIDSFERAFRAIFAERRETEEAILRCGKLMA